MLISINEYTFYIQNNDKDKYSQEQNENGSRFILAVAHWVMFCFLHFPVRKMSMCNFYDGRIGYYLCIYSIKVILRIFCSR